MLISTIPRPDYFLPSIHCQRAHSARIHFLTINNSGKSFRNFWYILHLSGSLEDYPGKMALKSIPAWLRFVVLNTIKYILFHFLLRNNFYSLEIKINLCFELNYDQEIIRVRFLLITLKNHFESFSVVVKLSLKWRYYLKWKTFGRSYIPCQIINYSYDVYQDELWRIFEIRFATIMQIECTSFLNFRFR